MRKMRRYRDFLIEELADRDKALSFLEVLLEEYEKDPDGAALYYGFSAAVEAQGGVQKFALKTHSTPQAVSDALLSKDEIQIAELLKKQVLAKRGEDKDIAQNGPLPKGWREVKIIDFSPLQRGFDLPAVQIKEGTYPVVYSNGIKNYHSEYKAKAPGVVTGRSGTIGEVTYVTQDYWPHNTSLWVTDFKGNHPKFVFYFLQNLRLDRFYAGSGVPTLNRNDVHKKSILIPSLPEQKAIASLLEKWDTAIEKTEALIEAKEKRFKWLLKTLISDQQDNPEWQKVKLGDICTFEYGKPLKAQDRKGDQYPVFGSNGIVGSHNEYLVAGPFIVVGRKGSAGTVLYSVNNGFPIDTTFYIDLQSEEIHLQFLYYLLLLVELDKISAQSGVPGLNRNDAYKISISIPSSVEQREITRTLDVASREIDLLKQLAEQYRTQKRGLMQKLLTGKWRVKEEKISCRT